VDMGWLVSLAAASVAYLGLSWKFDPAAESAAIALEAQGANTARMSAENS
jgi:hypothetical protein